MIRFKYYRSRKDRPKYAVPTYKRLLDIMAVAHRHGYREMKGHELMAVIRDLHPEVELASCSAALAGLRGRDFSVARLVKVDPTPEIPYPMRTEFRYHQLTRAGFYQSRFAKVRQCPTFLPPSSAVS